jgi:hypothetical protein
LLIATGRDENCNDIQAEWLITKQVPGNRISQTKAFTDLAGKKDECGKLVDKAVDLAITAVTDFHTKTGFNHNDFHPGNIFFDDAVTKANLIDFGEAVLGPIVSLPRVSLRVHAVNRSPVIPSPAQLRSRSL